MRYTTNYNMIIGEGTDAVNPLTQIFPNFETIDAAMEANKEHGVTTASEVTTGGVHAITRVDSSVNVFRFTATSAWTTGDTMTLDGQSVTVHLADGTAPKSGAYVIGAEVLAIVNASLVTLLTGASFDGVISFNSRQGVVTPQSGDYTANMIGYNNTVSGLTATDAQSAIDEVAGGLSTINTDLDIALNTNDVMTTTSTATYTLKKCQAGFVCINFTVPGGTASGTNLGTVASAYRPAQFYVQNGNISSPSDAGKNPVINILTDGNIMFYSDSTLSNVASFMVIYAI